MRDPMKTSSEPAGTRSKEKPLARTLSEVAAPGGRKRSQAAAPEREVRVSRAVEGVTTGSPAERGMWRVEEGPHGELLFEKRQDL